MDASHVEQRYRLTRNPGIAPVFMNLPDGHARRLTDAAVNRRGAG